MIELRELSSPHVISALRYRDVERASDWLCETFGFERLEVTTDDAGDAIYCELRLGSSVVILGSVRDPQFQSFMRQPDEIGGSETQLCYIAASDLDARFERAKAAGAEIVAELGEDPSGHRSFKCRDIEGHIWAFGTYAPKLPEPRREPIDTSATRPSTRARVAALAAWCSAILMVGSSAFGVGAVFGPVIVGKLPISLGVAVANHRVVDEVQPQAGLIDDGGARELAEGLRTARDIAAQAAKERDTLVAQVKLLRDEMERDAAARASAEIVARERYDAMERQRADLDAAFKAKSKLVLQQAEEMRDLTVRLEQASASQGVAERAVVDLRRALDEQTVALRLSMGAKMALADEMAKRTRLERDVQDLQRKLEEAAAKQSVIEQEDRHDPRLSAASSSARAAGGAASTGGHVQTHSANAKRMPASASEDRAASPATRPAAPAPSGVDHDADQRSKVDDVKPDGKSRRAAGGAAAPAHNFVIRDCMKAIGPNSFVAVRC
jgi:uncharacterized glyoxalase superfamily protein PhnB